RHTRFSRDWSSDVCSSDLAALEIFFADGAAVFHAVHEAELNLRIGEQLASFAYLGFGGRNILGAWEIAQTVEPRLGYGKRGLPRSEERRVGKECRAGGGGE